MPIAWAEVGIFLTSLFVEVTDMQMCFGEGPDFGGGHNFSEGCDRCTRRQDDGRPLMLYGRPLAEKIGEEVAAGVRRLKERGVTPHLAVILVGDNPSSITYVRMKRNACSRLGLGFSLFHLSEVTTSEELAEKINLLNQDPLVHGILLQHPLPRHIDSVAAFARIAPEKDVDGVGAANFGHLSMGLTAYATATPVAIIDILDYYRLPIEGRHAVVIGRSPILGRPVAMMLLQRNATVTICHSHTVNLPAVVQTADIVVAALGKPRFVQGEWLKPLAVVVDAGYNPGNIGDVDFASCAPLASAITPVPGGVGPVTIANLIRNTVRAAEKAAGKAAGARGVHLP